MIPLILLGIAVAWTVIAVPVAVLVGRALRQVGQP